MRLRRRGGPARKLRIFLRLPVRRGTAPPLLNPVSVKFQSGRPRGGDGSMRIVRALVLLAAVVGTPGFAAATSWVIPEPSEMLASADAVVLATVRDLRSVAAEDGSGIT